MSSHFVIAMKNGREYEEDGSIESLASHSHLAGKFFAVQCLDHVVLYNIDQIEFIQVTENVMP